MITIVSSSARIREFLEHCTLSFQRKPVGLLGFRVTFRMDNLDDFIKWYEGVAQSHIVVRYRGLNTFEVSDSEDLTDQLINTLRLNHAR